MATIKQIRANRRNAQKATGPKTQEGKDRVRFNALVHGLRAESAVIPGEDQTKFDQLLERLTAAWQPQDDQEKDLVEQIAVSQWKLARLDRNEARLYEPGALEPKDFALAIHRVYLTQVRLERSISASYRRYGPLPQESASLVKRNSPLTKMTPTEKAFCWGTSSRVLAILSFRRCVDSTASGA